MKTALLCLAAGASIALASSSVHATTFFDFETNSSTGSGLNPLGPDGFHPNGTSLTSTLQSTTGVTSGSFSMQVVSTAMQTYGGAQTSVANIPASFLSATSYSYDLTADASTRSDYFAIVPIFFTVDGEVDPDTSLPNSYANLSFLNYNKQTFTFNAAVYPDPFASVNGFTGRYTIAQVIAQDQSVDPTQAVTSFQFTVEHGGASGQTLEIDNVQSVAAPEPASLSLIGFAGLALVRRRRA